MFTIVQRIKGTVHLPWTYSPDDLSMTLTTDSLFNFRRVIFPVQCKNIYIVHSTPIPKSVSWYLSNEVNLGYFQ